ncbi:hypothetical protein PAEPH01_1568 [Pancytospora epiphaga]|nr:hypothetical protein PAEPH01_1568 [Pancytospora epiphaga]
MSSSEGSEVINRSRHHKKRQRIIESDSLEGDDSRSGHYGEYAPIFLEIFGTGHEYDYVLENEKADEKDELEESGEVFDVKACLEYIKNRVPGDNEELLNIKMIRNLAEGVSPEFISLHCSDFSICQIYYIFDLIQLFKINCKSVNVSKEPVPSPFPAILSLSDYIANLNARERIFEPSCDILGKNGESTFDLGEYTAIINQVATNHTFRNLVNLVYEQSRTAKMFECLPSVTKEMLYRLFTTDETTPSNSIRRGIIEEAYNRVDIDYRGIDYRLALCGCNTGSEEQSEERLFSNIFDSLNMLTNCISSLRGRPGTYAGMFYERGGYCKIVLVDECGNVTGQTACKEQYLAEIRDFIAGVQTLCISSDTPTVRYFLQNLDVPALYVPHSLSYFNDLKDYSAAYNIALLVQNPFIYFSRLVRSSSDGSSRRCELLKRAIRISTAVIKPDWKETLKHKYSFALLPILGINLSKKYFDYSNVNSLDSLSSVFDSKEFNNLATFFTLSDSQQPLDPTNAHPKDYSIARILCKSAFLLHNPGYNYNSTDNSISDENLKAVLSDLQQLENLSIPEDTADLKQVRALLLAVKPDFFPGATDEQIFQDVVPKLDLKATGIISKVGPTYYIVECPCLGTCGLSRTTAMVYVYKTGEYLLNQPVSLEMIEPRYNLLSYRGTIVEEPVKEEIVFIKHRLFRNVDHGTLLNLMAQDNQNVLIRPSSQKDCYVVVCRLYSGIFHSIRIKIERDLLNNSIESVIYDGIRYSGIDDFIDKYLKGMYAQVRGITSYRHFFDNEADAIAYISEKCQYVRNAIILSKTSPGYMEFLYQNKRVPVLIAGKRLQYKNELFNCVDEFISYAKTNFR